MKLCTLTTHFKASRRKRFNKVKQANALYRKINMFIVSITVKVTEIDPKN